MNFLIAPDKFKGSMDAQTVASVMKHSILALLPSARIKTMPLADGGEGSLGVLNHNQDFEVIKEMVQDPLGRKIEAIYLWDDKDKHVYKGKMHVGCLGQTMHPLPPKPKL